VFEFDPRAGELRKQGMKLKLQGQPLDILAMLLARPGEVVTREDLQKRLWASDTIVEFDHSLNAAIKRLRDALDDSAKTPRYVETLARRGYRFIAPVDSPAMPRTTSSKTALRGPLWRYKVWSAFAALATVAALASVGLLKYSGRKKPAEPFQTMQSTRLTTTGKAGPAAISPDGKYVAYATGEPDAQDLRVLQVATHRDIEIVPTEGQYWGLTFSPDGDYIWYVRHEKSNPNLGILYVVPVLGGPSRKVVTDVYNSAAISPDGNRLAFVRQDPLRDESVLIVANQDGSAERKLATRRIRDRFSGAGPAWSPDGRMITVGQRTGDVSSMNVVAIGVEGGGERPIGSERWPLVGRMFWFADRSGLVMLAQPWSSLSWQLWELSYPGGQVRRITNDLNNYRGGGVSGTSDSSTLVAVATETLSNLWIAPRGEAARARQISFGTARDGLAGLDWTADGRIVYATLATGSPELRVMDADGSRSRQLMTGAAHGGDSASACPDGRYIVFSSNRTGTFDIWRVDSDGANPKQLTRGGDYFFPSCSPDGKWVVFNSSFGGPRLWKISIDGGAPAQLTDYYSGHPAASPNGKWIASLKDEGDRMKIAVVPFEGGQPSKAFDYVGLNAANNPVRWTPDGRALAYIDTRKGVSNVWSQPLAGGSLEQITDFKSGLIFDFAWSRDGKQLALARGTVTSDVVLIRNFR
jgi:Tol biopolymer transport system component/DNA-binding winged helix-turn-helix (wHTH) protein